MFGKLGDMMGKLQEMKQKAEEIKTKLSETKLTVEGAGGDIKIVITGDRKIKDLSVTAALQHGDKAELEKQLLATINKALAEVEKINEEEMKKAAGGLLPGF
jgi:DNA-binding YbaB/EbfC family protein